MSPTSEILEVGCSFFPAPQSIAGSSSCHSLKSSCLFLEFVLIRESTVLKRTNESSSSTACSTEHLQVLMSQLAFSGCSLHSPKWKEVFKKYIYIYPAAVYSLLKSWERKKNALWCPSYCSEKSHIQFLLDWNCFVNPQSHELAYRYKAGSDCDCRWGEDRSGGCCSWSYSKEKKKTPL